MNDSNTKPADEQVEASQTVFPDNTSVPPTNTNTNDAPAAVPAATTSSGSKKKWLLPAAAIAVLALGSAYTFGMYLPNQPDAVYKNSLVNSGKAVDKLVEYSQKEMKSDKNAQLITGTITGKGSEASFDSTVEGEYDDKGNGTGKITANVVGQKFAMDIRSKDVATSENPDLYVRVTGVKSMLEAQGLKEYAALDGQWLAADHTLLDTAMEQAESASTNQPTAEQINDATAKVQAVNKEYLFTDDAGKAVVKKKTYEGKETKNDRSVFHYKATYDKQHLKDYIKAVRSALNSSKLNDWVKESQGQSFNEVFDTTEIEKSIDGAKDDYTFDLYVDAKTKLVQSVVFTDPENKDNSLTFAQNYSGSGSEYPFEISLKTKEDGSEKPTTGTLKMTVNTDTSKANIKLDADINSGYSGEQSMKINANFDLTSVKKDIKVDVPTSSKPITEVMQQMFGGTMPAEMDNMPTQGTSAFKPSTRLFN